MNLCALWYSLIKGIFKCLCPLCCVHTEAACCRIAPPGGHYLLCCYISISLAISFPVQTSSLIPLFILWSCWRFCLCFTLFLLTISTSVSLLLPLSLFPLPLSARRWTSFPLLILTVGQLFLFSFFFPDSSSVSNFDECISASLCSHFPCFFPLSFSRQRFLLTRRLKCESEFIQFNLKQCGMRAV